MSLGSLTTYVSAFDACICVHEPTGLFNVLLAGEQKYNNPDTSALETLMLTRRSVQPSLLCTILIVSHLELIADVHKCRLSMFRQIYTTRLRKVSVAKPNSRPGRYIRSELMVSL